MAPEKLLLDIKNYLYQIYVQKPELFKNPDMPLPRQIRLIKFIVFKTACLLEQ